MDCSEQREIESMILAFLYENNYQHTAFMFTRESRVPGLSADKVPLGELRKLLEKAKSVQAIEHEALAQSDFSVGLNSTDVYGNGLKQYIDQKIMAEMNSIIPKEIALELTSSTKKIIEGAKFFRFEKNFVVFANNFRLISRLSVDKDTPLRGQLAFSQINDSFKGNSYQVFLFKTHIFLAYHSTVAVFCVKEMQCVRVLSLAHSPETEQEYRRVDVYFCGTFYALRTEEQVLLLDGDTAAVVRSIEVKCDKLAAVGPFLYFLSLSAKTLLMYSMLSEDLQNIEIPAEQRLINFEANASKNFLLVLTEEEGERSLMFFAAGKTKKMCEVSLKGSFSRIKFGASLDRVVLFSEFSFSVFSCQALEIKESVKVSEQIANVDLLEDRVLVESAANTFKLYKFGQTGYFDYAKSDSLSHQVFVPELEVLAEFCGDSYSIVKI